MDGQEPVTLDEHAMARLLAAQMGSPPHAPVPTPVPVLPGDDTDARRLLLAQAFEPVATPQRGRRMSAEREAQLAALDADAQASGLQRDFDETTLLAARNPRPDESVVVPAAAHATAAPGPQAARPGSLQAPATSAAAPDAPLRAVGPYRVHKRLGRGGMGTVYRAVDPRNGGELAIKFLHASMCEDPESRARFMREARAARALSHPHIVAVHEVGEVDGRPYIAMELVRGMPLARELEQHAQLPLRTAVHIALQLAQALEYAHGRGVIHRDIKPGNILLLADGQTVKVSDFGIAHFADAPAERGSKALLMGTPQYMSPEQTRGEVVDGRSDLFSTGVVLYQLLAGERPFRGETLLVLAQRIALEEPVPLLQRRPDVPASLRRVVDRCLAKDPGDRYASGRELADALSAVLAELDTEARTRQGRRGLGLRAAAALAFAGVVALASLPAAALLFGQLQQAQWQLAEDQARSVARLVAAQHAPLALLGDWEGVAQQARQVQAARALLGLTVADAQGLVRSASTPRTLGLPLAASTGPQATAHSDGSRLRRITLADGSPGLAVQAPLVQQGKVLGQAEVLLDASPWLAPVQHARQLGWGLVLTLVLVAMASGWWLAGYLTRPLQRLVTGLNDIGRGRLDVRLDSLRQDELGQAEQAFDAMAQALQRRQAGLPPAGPGA
jgi:HAMP domain-containing protein